MMIEFIYFRFQVANRLFILSSYVRSKYSIIEYDFLSFHNCVAQNLKNNIEHDSLKYIIFQHFIHRIALFNYYIFYLILTSSVWKRAFL